MWEFLESIVKHWVVCMGLLSMAAFAFVVWHAMREEMELYRKSREPFSRWDTIEAAEAALKESCEVIQRKTGQEVPWELRSELAKRMADVLMGYLEGQSRGEGRCSPPGER